MKILAIHSITDNKPGAPVDLWRVFRPMEELKKHVDWQMDYAASVVRNINEYTTIEEFTNKDIEKAAKDLAGFDVIFISYWNLSAFMFGFLHVVTQRYGTQLVVDLDDDIFDVPYHNPIWSKVTKEGMVDYQRIIELAPFITTTNEHLAKKIRRKNKAAKVYVIPNYITDDYKHEPIDNGEQINVGYFGGSSHYRDLHQTGILPAIEKVMHEHKNVHFYCVGQPVDTYLPKARTHVIDPVNGTLWADKLFPTLNFDIALGPLQDDEFAKGKSNIKWQESTRMGAAFIASDIGPYKTLGKAARLVPNTREAWYIAINELVEDSQKRQKQLETARTELKNWQLDGKWQSYQSMFKEVCNANN